MEFTALFLAIVIVMIVAWRGSRALAHDAVRRSCWSPRSRPILHHATDALKLSF